MSVFSKLAILTIYFLYDILGQWHGIKRVNTLFLNKSALNMLLTQGLTEYNENEENVKIPVSYHFVPIVPIHFHFTI